MEYIITLLMLSIEMIALLSFNYAFFASIQNKKCFWAVVVGCYTVQAGYLICFNTQVLVNICFFYIVNLLLSIVAFEGRWEQKSIITAIFISLTYATDYIVTFMMMAIFHIDIIKIIMTPILFIINGFASKFTVYLISYFVRKYNVSKRKNTFLTAIQWMELLMFSLYSMFSIYLIIESSLYSDMTNAALIFDTIAIVACNVIIFSVISKLEDDNETKHNNLILEQQIKIEMESVTSLMEAYTKQRSMTHDFNNHISILQSLIENDNIQKAKEYINEMAGNGMSGALVVNSNNPVIDALLTQKYLVAKNSNIDVQIWIDDLSQIPMNNGDLVVVLSNLLDNAIEAAKQCLSQRSIKIKLVKDRENILLSVHNTTGTEIDCTDKVLKTAKFDKLNHGYGFPNIQSILNKYKYDYKVSCENGWFKFTVLMQ
ncbi:MAG: GHKL domain-containing protein [Oscillospiraceae bacterium]